MKNWMKNIICSREWTENGSGMDRVWSRIHSFFHSLSPDSILSRFCLASLIWIIIGGFSMSAWAGKDYYTCTLYEDLTTYGEKQKWGSNAEIHTYSFDNAVGADSIYFTYYYKEQVKIYYSTSKDGSSAQELCTISAATDNPHKSYGVWLTGAAKNAQWIQFKTVNGAGSLINKVTAQVDNFKVYRASSVSVDSASYEFAATPKGGYLDAEVMTITTCNVNTITADSITISGTNASYFSVQSIGSASGECPSITRTLTLRYSPGAITEGGAKHTATVTVRGGGKTTSFIVYGTATNVVDPTFSWRGVETTSKDMSDVLYVEGASLNLSTLWTSTNFSGTIVYDTISFTPASGVHTGATRPAVAKDGYTLSLGQAGVVELELAQAEATGYNACKDTIRLTIQRNPNTLKCAWDGGDAGNDWNAEIGFDTKYRVKFSSTNTSGPAITVTQSPVSAVATYKAGAGGANPDTIISNYRKGDGVTWTVIQAEDYKYVADTATCTVDVRPVSSPSGNIIKLYDNHNSSSDVKCSEFGEHVIDAPLGHVVKIYFEAKRTDGWTNSVTPKQKVNGEWITAESKVEGSLEEGKYKNPADSLTYFKKSMSPNATAIKFETSDDARTRLRHVFVTGTPYLSLENAGRSEISSITLPKNYKGGHMTRDTFYVDFGTCANTVKLVSSNEHITFAASSSTTYSFSTGSDHHGLQEIALVYTSPAAAENISATITVYTEYEHETLTVNAQTKDKLDTHLEYIGENTYNANHDTIDATDLFQVVDENDAIVASPTITLSSNNTSTINPVKSNTAVAFVCSNASAVTVTASYAGDGTYERADNLAQAITVNKAADVITWDAKVVNDTLRVWSGDTIPYTIATAHTSEDKPITFTSRDATILRVGSGVAIDTLITLKYDTVWLVAQTAADCKYSSVKDSIVVIVKPCPHRIVWTDDFAGLHTEEDGKTIDYTSEPMSAYAVDSTSKSTGVSISYSLSPGTTIAEIDKDNKLHVTGVGETMVYATTAADDKYAVVTDSLLVRVLTWGENHAKIVQDEFEGNREWSGPHAKFVISGDGQSTTTFGGDGRKLAIEKNKVQTISWTVDDNCTINVTGLKLKVGSSSPGNGDFNLYGERVDKIAGWNTNVINITTLSQGNSGNITLSGSKDFNIYYLDVTYTITPSVAPTPTEGVSEVYVTVDPESPVLLDISDVFSIADAPSDFTYVCDTIEKNSHVHFADGKTKFWADAIGDYTIKGRVAAASDHRSSAWSSTYKTIRVVRQPNTLYVGGVADYSGNMQLNSTLALALTASNTDYAGSPISVEQIRGADTISYNQSTGQVTSSTVEGTGMWRISQAQSDKYLAAEATFTVNVVANDKTYSGGEIDWTDKDEVTVSANVTIEEPISVYKLNISSGTTVTVTASGGLSIGMGGIDNASDNKIKLESNTDGQTGFLRIDPEYAGAMPEVDVEMYSKAYHDKSAATGSKSKYQCVGAPISDEGVRANTVYPAGTWIYTWNESTEGWTSCRTSMTFEAFKGFETTQKLAAAGKNYTYSGHIVSGHEVKTIDLDYSAEEKGYNLLANSFTAPIDIASFDVDAEDGEVDFVNAQQTIYFLNAGTRNQSASPGEGVDAPGKWVGVPIKTAEELAKDGLPRMIPSMQGFWVKATGDKAQLKLDYSRLVWGVDYSGIRENKPLRARKQNAEEELPITGKLKISITAEEGNDYLFMLESERYDAAYEDGYDAYKIPSGGVDIFAVEGEDELGVDATNSIIGTKIGLRTGEEYEYTMKFSRVQTEDDLALLDKEEGKEIDIEEGTEYAFFATQNATITDRFEIVSRGNAPAITTGTDGVGAEVKAQKFIKNNSLYIYKDGALYNALGERVR